MRLLVLSFLLPLAAGSSQISEREARFLVENTPDVQGVKKRGGCPRFELLWRERDTAVFQARNFCAREGSGMIGNYRVDLTDGTVWSGIDKDNDRIVDSTRLRSLRRHILGNGRGTHGKPR